MPDIAVLQSPEPAFVPRRAGRPAKTRQNPRCSQDIANRLFAITRTGS
jgi:hypothetical protein